MKLFSAGLCRDYPERPAIVGNGYRCTAVLLNYSASVEEAADLLAETGTGFLLCGDNAA